VVLGGRGGGAARAGRPPRDPATGRAVVGGGARRPTATATIQPAAPAAAQPQQDASASVAPAGPSAAAQSEPATPPASAPDPAAAAARPVPEVWRDSVKSQLKPLVRALFSAGEFTTEVDGVWMFSVPNEAHGAKCAEHQADVEAALSAAMGEPVIIRFIAGGSTASPTSAAAPASAPSPVRPEPSRGPDAAPQGSAPHAAPAAQRESAIDRAKQAAANDAEPEPEPAAYVPADDDEIDMSELTDAPPEAVKTPIERLAEAFPGSELVDDDRN
jgi:DNA polymerase-3 subunit gamma/tau